ncbi:MAG: bifunctional hydroxymethylpyrimidine kinase/phosphomethylpyrimidine kinase [Clostridiales bacterium]|jgi:hydroxymethylpyrimidine/phosphomethylpyrimidine kinase|nr:bifunctional hydroxymethylpyrimidine kinase/phosphomethylpyrimidine kinase [Clostridiales bacterium]
MYKALTIAGSDSGGGAGIQTDLKTFTALGVYGTSVITALTAQNTLGVHGIHTVPEDFIARQLEAVLSDIPVQAAKTGMLGDSATISVVAEMLTKYRILNLVVDPVMIAQSGDRLLQEDSVDVLRNKLLPLSLIATPNLPEAGFLLDREITNVSEMETAAKEIRLLGPRCVLVKGGHLPGEEMVDVFYDGNSYHHLTAKKIDTKNTHGTGCTYAAAITAHLARGLTPLEAVQLAKHFITDAISHGICVGAGYGPTNPIGSLLRELETSRVIEGLRTVLEQLMQSPGVSNLLAEGETNLFYALEDAITLSDIASYSAPLLRSQGKIEALGAPVFDSAHPVAPILLAARQTNSRIRLMINLRFSEEIIAAAQAMDWSIVEFTETPLFNSSDIPSILYDRGTSDRPPQIFLFASTPTDLADKTATLARCFRGC